MSFVHKFKETFPVEYKLRGEKAYNLANLFSLRFVSSKALVVFQWFSFYFIKKNKRALYSCYLFALTIRENTNGNSNEHLVVIAKYVTMYTVYITHYQTFERWSSKSKESKQQIESVSHPSPLTTLQEFKLMSFLVFEEHSLTGGLSNRILSLGM